MDGRLSVVDIGIWSIFVSFKLYALRGLFSNESLIVLLYVYILKGLEFSGLWLL